MQNETEIRLSYEELRQENAYLKEQLTSLKRMIFGQSRERFIPGSDRQLSIFGNNENGGALPLEKEEISYLRNKTAAQKQTPHFRNPIPDHIPRKEIIIEPQDIDTKGLKKIGEEITEELEYEEAKLDRKSVV